MKGRFITIEGAEGAGKSTNIALLERLLTERGIDHLRSREPGGTALAERIRSLLLDDDGLGPSALAELLLIFAARADHLEKCIVPALEQGQWVICDRFTDATFAYQGYGRGLPRAAIEALQTITQGQLRPDLTIILDLDPAVGLQRIGGRGGLDRIERESIDFHAKVRNGYVAIAKAEPERCVLIDAAADPAQVAATIRAALVERLPELQ